MRFLLFACTLLLSHAAYGFEWPKASCEKDFKTVCPDKLPTKANITGCFDSNRDRITAACLKDYDAFKSQQAKTDEKKANPKDVLNAKKASAKASGEDLKKSIKDGDGSALKDSKKKLNNLLK